MIARQNQHQSVIKTHSLVTKELRESKLIRGNQRMIMAGQNIQGTQKTVWTVYQFVKITDLETM